MKEIIGGVCASLGFKAAGVYSGIRKNKNKKDLGLITSEVICNSAAVYTRNLVFGAPIKVTRDHLKNGKAQAIIVNSGNANTCNSDGVTISNEICKMVSKETGIKEEDVIVASTGVIGQKMSLNPFETGIPQVVKELNTKGSNDCSNAMMTTDTVKKEIAFEFEIGGYLCHIGGIAKGSGMIHPNMATMLCFITTDVAITSQMLQKAISSDVVDSFNMISVDGDTSTNDMLAIMASGMVNNPIIKEENDAYDEFCKALNAVTLYLAKMMAKDGEGASRLVMVEVANAETKGIARTVARSVVSSNLVKAAMFGSDANFGRILCAIGYSGAKVDPEKIDVSYKSCNGIIEVCKDGYSVDFSEELAKDILKQDEITIQIDLKSGVESATAYGCDLTYEYVKINGDYRS